MELEWGREPESQRVREEKGSDKEVRETRADGGRRQQSGGSQHSATVLQDYLAHEQPLLQPLLLRGSSQPPAVLRCSNHLSVACGALLLQQRSLPGRQPLLLRGKDAQVVVGSAHQQAAGVGAKAQRVHALHEMRGGEMSGGQQVCALPCMLEWRRHTECCTQDATTQPPAHRMSHPDATTGIQ